ncbi:MAG: hypothetical protein AB7O73_15980 [Bacteroidia bacterium]
MQGRNSPTPEQIQQFIALKKAKRLKQIEIFKRTFRYKWMNVFNIICLVVYTEMIICTFGPSHYDEKICSKSRIKDFTKNGDNARVINRMTVWDENGKEYMFFVNEMIQPPVANSKFYVGKDFLMNKELNVMIETSSSKFRLWYALPFLFLGVMVSIVTFFIYLLNMNLFSYSLTAITLLNALNLAYFLFF